MTDLPEKQRIYILPNDLHQVLKAERISVSPSGLPVGPAHEFYAFVYDLYDEVNAFGCTPSDAVANVLTKLGKPHLFVDADELNSDAAVAAIQFSLKTDEGLSFLRCWNDGDFDSIRREWPEAPNKVFFGAECQQTDISQSEAVSASVKNRGLP